MEGAMLKHRQRHSVTSWGVQWAQVCEVHGVMQGAGQRPSTTCQGSPTGPTAGSTS